MKCLVQYSKCGFLFVCFGFGGEETNPGPYTGQASSLLLGHTPSPVIIISIVIGGGRPTPPLAWALMVCWCLPVPGRIFYCPLSFLRAPKSGLTGLWPRTRSGRGILGPWISLKRDKDNVSRELRICPPFPIWKGW